MHFKRGSMNQQPRADELLMLVVLAQDVTHILTEKTLDALAKFLHPLDVGLLHAPCAVWQVWRPGPKFLDRHLRPVVPRDIGHEIADYRKGVHRLEDDRHIEIEIAEPSHAHELRHAIDFRRARAALAGLAVPSDCKIGRVLRLDAMHGV